MSLNKLTWVTSVMIMLGLVLFASINSYGVFADKTEGKEIQIKEVEIKPDPKIALLSSYIKTRKSVTPIEVCDKIAYEIITQSKLNHIAEDIIVGIIEIESMWDIYATSKMKAKGLMQILIEDGVEILPEKAYGIAYNIEKGIAIFKSKLQKSKGDVTLALQYYVGGDPDYHKAVYKYLGKYTLYKIDRKSVV